MSLDRWKGSFLDQLPTLPLAALRIKELLSSPTTTAADLEKVIRPDPSITANLLRLANSPFFGFPRAVESVRQAIVLLGEKRLFEVVMGVAFSGLIPPVLPGYNVKAKDFWLHSVAVAVLAERLSVLLKIKVPDMIFSAGLLHDIGKLAVGMMLAEAGDLVRGSMRQESLMFVDAERAALGVDHCEIGGIIAARWQLPEVIALPVRWHHDPEAGPAESQQTLYIIQVADALAHSMGFGSDIGELARQVGAGARERLHLKVRHLEQLASEAIDSIHEAARAIRLRGEAEHGIPNSHRR
jgi:HD-like signal output (HDOD) protein